MLAAVVVAALLVARADAVSLHNTLVVDKAGTGAGHVGSTPAYIDCGNVCYASLPTEETGGVPLVLRATPAPGSTFTGWSGACAGSAPSCTLELIDSAWVTAIFDVATTPTSFPLAVGRTGDGTVTSDPPGIACGADCTESFTTGASLSLAAAPAAGFSFAGWEGDCSGAGACTLTMDGPKTVTANFTPLPSPTPPPPPPPQMFPLAVGKSGTGTVTSDPPGINCGSVCAASFPSGTDVSLTATPAPGSAFTRWSGGCDGTGATCTVRVDGARSIVALFNDKRDTSAPTVKALASAGKRGKAVRLRYRVRDDSGRSRETVTVKRGRRVLATVRGRLDAADADVLYYFVTWRVPKTLPKSTLTFCVQAFDAAGNSSSQSCASLRLR